MNWLIGLVRQPMLERVGWTLVHSVWECAAVAIILAAVLLFLRRADARYGAALAALAACLVGAVVTFIILRPRAAVIEHPPFIIDAPMIAIPQAALSVPTDLTPTASSPSLRAAVPVAAVVWLAGVVLLCARHVMGWMSLRRLRHTASPIEDPDALDRLNALTQRMRLRRRIALAESLRVRVPSVIGWLRPMILLPVSTLSGLSPLHLEAILAHELAHIRRQDYLINLIQLALETLLFYHPAVWWISKVIRQEREHCCDDLAVKVIGDVREYGQALAAMEELRAPGALAMAASGGSLLRRIHRLARPEPRRMSGAWPMLGMIGVIALISLCARMNQAKSAQVPENAPATQPAEEPFDPAKYLKATAAEIMKLTPEQGRAVDAAKQARQAAPTTRPAATQPTGTVVPAIQSRPQLGDLARQELSDLSQAYTAAQLQRIELEAAYGADNPRLVQLKRTEEELYAKYHDRLRQVISASEIAAKQIEAAQASPEVPATQPNAQPSAAEWTFTPTTQAWYTAENWIPATQPSADSQLHRELADLIRAYQVAQLQRINAEATYGANSERLLQMKKAEEELYLQYKAKLQQVMALNQATTQTQAQPALPQVLAAIREAFGDHPKAGSTDPVDVQILLDRLRRQSARVDELNLQLAQQRIQYAAQHPAVVQAEQELKQVEEQLKASQEALKKLDAQEVTQQAAAATSTARIEYALQNQWRHQALQAQVDNLKKRLDDLAARGAQADPGITDALKQNLAAAEEELRKDDEETRANLRAQLESQQYEAAEVLKKKLAEVSAQIERIRTRRSELVQNGADPPVLQTIDKTLGTADRNASEIQRVLDERVKSAPAPTYYIGGAPNSGMYPIPNGQSIALVDALNRGNIAQLPDSMEKFVVVVHQTAQNGQKSNFIRVQDALNEPPERVMRVIPGDVIMITTLGSMPLAPEARYQVLGHVNKPGFYPLQKNMTLLQAVVAAGVNPPEIPGRLFTWKKASEGNATVREMALTDLIDGAIGMEMISAGDVITVKPPNTPPAQPF